MEDKSLSLSMPVVTEEDEENESFSETGTDEICQTPCIASRFRTQEGMTTVCSCDVYLWYSGEFYH